jgi:hypothetical protein
VSLTHFFAVEDTCREPLLLAQCVLSSGFCGHSLLRVGGHSVQRKQPRRNEEAGPTHVVLVV